MASHGHHPPPPDRPARLPVRPDQRLRRQGHPHRPRSRATSTRTRRSEGTWGRRQGEPFLQKKEGFPLDPPPEGNHFRPASAARWERRGAALLRLRKSVSVPARPPRAGDRKPEAACLGRERERGPSFRRKNPPPPRPPSQESRFAASAPQREGRAACVILLFPA